MTVMALKARIQGSMVMVLSCPAKGRRFRREEEGKESLALVSFAYFALIA
jgi:hypothetical protein